MSKTASAHYTFVVVNVVLYAFVNTEYYVLASLDVYLGEFDDEIRHETFIGEIPKYKPIGRLGFGLSRPLQTIYDDVRSPFL